MKKVIAALCMLTFLTSCVKSDPNDETLEEQLTTNQIESVDGTKIKRPGNGG